MNQEKIKALSPQELLAASQWHFEKAGLQVEHNDYSHQAIALIQERCKTLIDVVEQSRWFFCPVEAYDPAALKKWVKAGADGLLASLVEKLTALTDWEPEAIQAAVQAVVDENEVGFAKVAQPVRIAITGGTNSPSIDQSLSQLGRDEALARLNASRPVFAEYIANR